jgi:hypothetical protein
LSSLSKTIVRAFDARDQAGRLYRIIEWRKQIGTDTQTSRGSLLGLPEFRLDDGRARTNVPPCISRRVAPDWPAPSLLD